VLPKYFNELHYIGRGPWDNYPDRKESCHIGRYKSTVAEQYFHNPKPQDSGNHEDVAYVCLSNGRDHISVSAIDGTFSFSALPYSATQLATTKHDYELRAENYVYLNLDAAVLGIGNGSCGPGVLKKYAIEQKPHTLHVKLRIENLKFIIRNWEFVTRNL
jgi:beta-galactosidase